MPNAKKSKRCKEMGVRPSMGSVGDAYDNGSVKKMSVKMGQLHYVGIWLTCETLWLKNA
jgi:hypothetical protein